MKDEEVIVCAAIWYKDGKQYDYGLRPRNIDSGYVLCGIRHGHILQQHLLVFGRNNKEYLEHPVQGFITNKNRFVDRIEGAHIHVETGGKLNYHNNQLFSEDLY